MRDASTLPALLTLANLVCACLWGTYGAATRNMPVMVANASTIAVNAFLGVLFVLFRHKRVDEASPLVAVSAAAGAIVSDSAASANAVFGQKHCAGDALAVSAAAVVASHESRPQVR